MDNKIKELNDQIAKEQGEIAKVNKNLQEYQAELQRLVKVGNMREGRISLLKEQLEVIKPKKESEKNKTRSD